MTFWLSAAALVLVVAVLVVVPAWRAQRMRDDPAVADQVRRFAELEDDLATGEIDPNEAAALRAELERAVVEAVPVATAPLGAGNRWLLVLVVAATLLAAVPLYHHLGMPRLATRGLDTAPDAHQSIAELLDRVRARTREAPDDHQAWTMLARSTLALGDYAEAVTAAERAHALVPDDVPGMLLLVDALAMRAEGRIDARSRELLARVLAAEPDNPTGLVLAGIAAQQDGGDTEAARLWQRALAILPPEAPFRAELVEMIAQVDPDAAAPGGTAPAAPTSAALSDTAGTPAATPAGDAVAIDVRVTLAPDLDAPATATVFVVARAVDGPPAPLAVARHRVDELPLAVRLDESMAMVPGVSLGTAQTVTVVARVSRSGNALAQPGDLFGESAPFDPRAQGRVEILIDRVQP